MDMNSYPARRMAIIAGFSLLAMAVLAGFSYGYGLQEIYVPGNETATLQKLRQSPVLFRLVLLSFSFILILDIIVAWALYQFFRQANQPLSMLSAWFRLVYSALLGMALSYLTIGLHTNVSEASAEGRLMSAFQTFLNTWSLGLLIFACHLVLLGIIAVQSGLVPRIIGFLVLLAGCCYSVNSVIMLTVVSHGHFKQIVDIVLSFPMAAGELIMACWLLFKGGKFQPNPAYY